MGKKKSNVKESENGDHITKLSESPAKKINNSGRPKASILASLFCIALIGSLSVILGLIFIEIESSSKDLNRGILKHDTMKKEILPHDKESLSKASISKETRAPPPPPPPPLKSESEIKMDLNKIDAADAKAEPVPKKQKIEENIVKKSEAPPDKDFSVNLEKQIEIESQIIQDSPHKINKDKEAKISEKDKPSKPSPSAGKSKVEENPEKFDDKSSHGTKSEATLKELYIEVEGLAEEILQEDPENSMVKELAPHLEGVLRDLEGGKLLGLRDSLLHIKVILSDLKVRLEESKHQKESDKTKISKPDTVTPETEDKRVPVDEVIPDPIYIAPLGDTDKHVDHKPLEKPSTLDSVSRVEEKPAEKRTQDQPKKSSKVDEKISQPPPPIEKEKQQKSDSKPEEKKNDKIINEELLVQSNKDSEKDSNLLSKETTPKEKSKENLQNIKVTKKETEQMKDEKSSKIGKNSEEKVLKAGSEKRKLPETENEEKAKHIEEVPVEKKLKTPTDKVKRDTKSSVKNENQDSDLKNLDMKQVKKLKENEELKSQQKDTVKTPKQTSSECVLEDKSADKSEEGNKLKDNNLQSCKKLEDEKTIKKNEEKTSPKTEDAKTHSKVSEVKEKSEEQNLGTSSEEKHTVKKPTGKEKQHMSGTDQLKTEKPHKHKSSTSADTNKKTPSKTLEKNTKEVKSSETDEKLKLASALEDENLIQALSIYDSLFQEMPKSPIVLYRRAIVLDKLSKMEKSNQRLEQAIQAYLHLLDLSSEIDIPKDILKDAGLQCADRMNFRGPSMFAKEREILRILTKNFDNDTAVLNKIGIFYLLMNRNEEAEVVYKKILEQSPEDGLALVHYGFILKTRSTDKEGLIEASSYMERGINSDVDGVHDIRMYYHLGDALQRLGQNERAYKVYDEGVSRGLFLSRYQRSTYNIARLKSKPLWTPEETTYEHFFKKIQSNWKEIKREGVLALKVKQEGKTNIGYSEERENLRETGTWKQFELFVRGKKHTEHCKITPFTCSLIEEFKPASGCKVGQSKYSVMDPGTHVYPHTGPTNCRLRSHLGLVTTEGARIRVINETFTWEEGKLFIFDDSFEHEVWHDGNMFRLVLIIDVWHPDLTDNEIKTINPV